MKLNFNLPLLSVFLCILINKSYGFYKPVLVSQIKVNKPAFATFIPNLNGDKYHVAISSFNGAPYSADHVFHVANFSLNSSYPIQQLSNKNLVWPNEISYTNKSVISPSVDPYGGLVVPGGFLVPTKENGGIFYYPYTSGDRSSVTTSDPIEFTLSSQGKTKWFYHRVIWADVSGDGQDDILTCRTYKPIIGSTKTELVAFLFDNKTQTFDEKVILNDVCDVFFEVADVDRDGRFEIIASGFFISKLNVIYSNDPNNSFLNGNIIVRTIDPTGGNFFDIRIDDLDGQGNLELLVTNHQGNKDKVKGSLYFYTLTGSVKTGNWTRNLVYNNFPVIKSGISSAAPGSAKAFYPNLKDKTTRKYILVAGDGSEHAYLFQPTTTGALSYTLVWTQLYKGILSTLFLMNYSFLI